MRTTLRAVGHFLLGMVLMLVGVWFRVWELPWWALGLMLAAPFVVWVLNRWRSPSPDALRQLRLQILQARLAKLLEPKPRRSPVGVKAMTQDVVSPQDVKMMSWRELPQAELEALGNKIELDAEAETLTNWRTPTAKAILPVLLGITRGSQFQTTRFGDLGTCPDRLSYVYSHTGLTYTVAQFEKYRTTIEEMWGGPVIIEQADTFHPGCVRIRPMPSLPDVIPFMPAPAGKAVFGTDLMTGQVVTLDVADIPHLLIMGTSGFGKSVFLHQLVAQLVNAPSDVVERVLLVDLKGGVEFLDYADADARVSTVWQFEDVIRTVAELVQLMEKRLAEMKERRWRIYKGKRVFFIVDEFAQIQLYPVEGKEGRLVHDRLLANLNRLSMLGRAAGIVLLAAIQKATTDVMDSSFRTNLQGQVCFRVSNRLAAASMFGTVEDLRFDPLTLPRGRYIFYDPTIGATRYLQAHKMPEPEEDGRA